MKVFGLNQARIVNSLVREGVCVSKVESQKDAVTFAVPQKELKKTEEYLNGTGRKYEVTKNAGLLSVFFELKKRKGLILGFLVALAAIIFLSNLILGINIKAEADDEKIIRELLKERGIGVFSFKKDVDKEALRLEILNGIESLSFVEIEQEGAFLNISLLSELSPEDIVKDTKSPLVATVDAVVTRVVVLSGTSLVGINKPVKAGDTLIAPYIMKGEGKEECRANGMVYGRVFRKTRVAFFPYTVERVRTGRVEKINTVSAFSLSTKSKPTAFSLYETEKKMFTLTALFPLNVIKETRYELTDITVAHDFSEEKDMLIEKAYKELRAELPKSALERDKYYIIKELDNCILIDVYLETEEIISAVS